MYGMQRVISVIAHLPFYVEYVEMTVGLGYRVLENLEYGVTFKRGTLSFEIKPKFAYN